MRSSLQTPPDRHPEPVGSSGNSLKPHQVHPQSERAQQLLIKPEPMPKLWFKEYMAWMVLQGTNGKLQRRYNQKS